MWAVPRFPCLQTKVLQKFCSGSGNNNWLQMGDDNKAAERLCTIHNSRYTPPQWGKISGNCGFSNLVDPCYPRGHVFCCKNSSWAAERNSPSSTPVLFIQCLLVRGLHVCLENDSWRITCLEVLSKCTEGAKGI